MEKTYAGINGKIRNGEALVLTAEEVIEYARENGIEKAAKEIDVVTTATFGSMCSSGAFLNTGHSSPRIKFGGGSVTLNAVECYAGLAAVDIYIGATAARRDDPRNSRFPGEFLYGGGHVIHDLVAGRQVRLQAKAYGTSCYPRTELDKMITLVEMKNAVLVNPRNAYQNYNVAVNASSKTIYTYMGKLLPNMGNASYSSAGQLSPLLNDPFFETIGMGTRIWLAGAQGYVFWNGTQHNPDVKRGPNGVPSEGAGTLATVGNMKEMDPEYLRGSSITGYGNSLAVGIGVPIPILNERIMKNVMVSDAEIFAPVVDYSHDYPNSTGRVLASVSYEDLKSGTISIGGKKIPTGSMSSYRKAREIAGKLKNEIKRGKFLVQEPVQKLPSVKRMEGTA